MEQFLSILFGLVIAIVFGMVAVEFILEAIRDKNKDDRKSEI